MKKIKYIGYYYPVDSKEKRNGCLAAINKMNYIAESLVKIGYNVDIISPSWYINDEGKLTSKKYIKIANNIDLIQAPSYKTKNRYTGYLKSKLSQLWLFLYLLKNTKKNEQVIVYHSLALMWSIKLLIKIKKLKLILEVEEVYSDVIKAKNKLRKVESEFISIADKYISPTELLNETINKNNKKNIIIYGTYKVEFDIKKSFNDNKIHIVYAGTFEFSKGVLKVIDVAKYLDKKYHIHIIGFGNQEEIKKIKDTIYNISTETSCMVTYDGLFSGEEYIKFLQRCHIGISPQNVDALYNKTSFPSKVLSYLSNGLRVVSIGIESIKKSEVKNLIYFYDIDNEIEIAKKIKSINFNEEYDSRRYINVLDEKFKINLKKLLED